MTTPRMPAVPTLTRRKRELRAALKKAEALAFEIAVRGGLVPGGTPVRGFPRTKTERKFVPLAANAFPYIRQARRELGDVKD